MKIVAWLVLIVVAPGVISIGHADGWDPDTRANNLVAEGIKGTRHNMTMSYMEDDFPQFVVTMDIYRNNYGEVCVYCHTPHGANTSSGGLRMPLWNRTVNPSLTYQPYDMPTTLGFAGEQNVTHPGPASLTCLSCHDGVTAVDSIINMPGSGPDRYMESQETSVNTGFLGGWSTSTYVHYSLGACAYQCHNEGMPADFSNFVTGAGPSGVGEPYLMQTVSSVDLRDDHPIGVLYPTALTNQAWVGFRVINAEVPGRYAFFDDGNGRADKDEIRLYDSGEGFEVECASCHDPHGVPDAANVEFIPSFLRVSNEASALCLTCHIK
ncbi:MAG: cytochrome c3 family protein [Gammaproteobacteria bacterium]|nr:cytochrome c3 family protein [Gammaproteobacteria bacterium]MCF6231055.1 cytochrome c3 family protein [Gammaproteobacteria bacterium]